MYCHLVKLKLSFTEPRVPNKAKLMLFPAWKKVMSMPQTTL